MSTDFTSPVCRGFTRLEMMVSLAVILLLAGMVLVLLMPYRHDHSRAWEIACVNYLKQVGFSFQMFANDHDGKYPMQLSTNQGGTQEFVSKPAHLYRHFQVVSNILTTPKVVVCPADSRVNATNFIEFGNSNISYFLCVDADATLPGTTLAGHRNLKVAGVALEPGEHRLTSDAVIGFTLRNHRVTDCVVLSDCSVQKVTVAGLVGPRGTNRVTIP